MGWDRFLRSKLFGEENFALLNERGFLPEACMYRKGESERERESIEILSEGGRGKTSERCWKERERDILDAREGKLKLDWNEYNMAVT